MIFSIFKTSALFRLTSIFVTMALTMFIVVLAFNYCPKDRATELSQDAEHKSKKISTHLSPERTQPPLRFVPKFPEDAQKSGHCFVEINFDENGKVDNAEIEKCTDSVFEKPTLEAVYKWIYPRRIRNGKPVPFRFSGHKVSYRLMDKNGNIIPE